MDVQQILYYLNAAPPQKKAAPKFFVTGNNAYLVQYLVSRLTRSQMAMPTRFSLYYVSGLADVLVFGTSASFADKCLDLISSGSTGVLALDVSYPDCANFAQVWATSLRSKELKFHILAFNVSSDQMLTRASECLLRAVALTQRAGFARAHYTAELGDVAYALISGESLGDARRAPYFIPPGKDTSSQILQNARSAEEIIEKMSEKLKTNKQVEERIFSNVDDYIRWVDQVGKCGPEIAEIARAAVK